MRVQLLDTPLGEDRLEWRTDIGGDGAGVGLARGLVSQRRDRRTGLGGPGFELLDGFLKRPVLADKRIAWRGGSGVDKVERKIRGGQVDSPFIRLTSVAKECREIKDRRASTHLFLRAQAPAHCWVWVDEMVY